MSFTFISLLKENEWWLNSLLLVTHSNPFFGFPNFSKMVPRTTEARRTRFQYASKPSPQRCRKLVKTRHAMSRYHTLLSNHFVDSQITTRCSLGRPMRRAQHASDSFLNRPPNDTQTWSKRDMRIRVVDNLFQPILWILKFLG